MTKIISSKKPNKNNYTLALANYLISLFSRLKKEKDV